MDNSDAFSSPTVPLTWHDFLERMRNPSAAEFVKAIKSFIVTFLNNAPDAERDSSAVQAFLGNIEVAFRAHSLWAGSSEEELESAGEGLEKYVMTKLFTRVFASIQEDVKADDELHEKMALLQQFIRPENLDIKPTYQNETSWLLAQKELQKINMYKAPRDKLVCILNCCKVISNLLLNASQASNNEHPGADEFLPVLIYVTIKANPPQLHSNLAYIQRFRRETRLSGEAAYFFTNMLSVESFISNIDAKAISMDESEYESNMEFARSLISGLSDNSNSSYSKSDQNSRHIPKPEPVEPKPALSSKRHQSSVSSEAKSRNSETHGKDQVSLNESPSISDLENKGATMLLKEKEASQIFREFPFLYSQAKDLTVGDVDDLLNNYKQLVFKYVCLARGVGGNDPAPLLANARDKKQEQLEIAKESEDMSVSNLNRDIQNQSLKQPEVGEQLQKNVSESIFNTDIETRIQDLEQPKQLERTSEPIPETDTDAKDQNPEVRKNISEIRSDHSSHDVGQMNIESAGVEDSVEGSIMSEEVTIQTQGDESLKVDH